MSKPAAAIACCLLVAAPAAGCHGRITVPEGVTEHVSAQIHDDIHRQAAAAAAQTWGWNPADVVVEPTAGTAGTGCELLAVRSPNALPSHTRTLAVVEGELLLPGSAGALERVLAACNGEASADAWAEAVAAFGQGVPVGYVVRLDEQISSLAHRRAMDAGGYAFHPPRFSADAGDTRTVEFFLTDLESTGLYQVRAARRGDGTVDVAVVPAGSL